MTTTPTALPHRLGWKKDAPDRRDRALYATVPNIAALPDRADNEKYLPADPMDQGETSSCTGFSGANLFYSVMVRDGHLRPFVPSPVFLYRAARDLGGYLQEDGGAEIRNIFKAANKLGLPPMSNLRPRFKPADLADPQTGLFGKDSIWVRSPSPSLLADAERRQAVTYHRLATLNDLLKCLADGWPAQVGVTLFPSLYGETGPRYEVPDPARGEAPLGGHAVVAFGYDRATRRIMFRNQWGAAAHEGRPNFTLSWEYVARFMGDAWCCNLVEGGKPQ